MLNATRPATYSLVRAEVVNCWEARQAALAAQGPALMDLDPLTFGKHGKHGKTGKVGGKSKGGKTGGKSYDDKPC